MARVLACPPVPELCRTELEGLCDTVSTLNFDGSIVDEDAIDRWDAAFITPQAFMSCGGMEGLFALYDRLAALVTAGKVGYVHLCAAGVDVELFHSVIRACVSNNVCLSHCPGVYAVPMAQYVMTYVMHILRKVPEHTAQQAAGVYAGLTCTDAREACIGVLGAGGIGEEVARMSKAFGMRAVGWRRSEGQMAAFDEMRHGDEGMRSILREADFVVVSVPLTPATKRMIGATELALMKPTAWLINVSRGPVLDEAALAMALGASEPKPAGAVLDVYEVEPLPADSPLWKLTNVILTAHDSWRTTAAFADNRAYFVENLRRRLAGEAIRGEIAPDSELAKPALEGR